MTRQRTANVIGLGLVGGSVALGLRQRGWRVHGDDARPDTVARAVELEVIDDSVVTIMPLVLIPGGELVVVFLVRFDCPFPGHQNL